MAQVVCILFTFLLSTVAVADPQILHGENLHSVPLHQALQSVSAGDVVLVSELHGVKEQHDFQIEVIRQLQQRGLQVNVGIEHISHLEQEALDAYLRGELPEAALLKVSNMQDFSNWKTQLLLPLAHGGWSYGLNAPRWLTGKINAVGYELLSAEEKSMLPPDFSLGSEKYKKRILQIMGTIHPFAGFDNFFAAQSAWDDTSAWKIIQLQQQDPQSVLVVLFGDFHIAYGGGLPDRLAQRGFKNFISFSQIYSSESPQSPHPEWGVRANYIVLHPCEELSPP